MLFYCNSKIPFTLLKAKKKTNQVIMRLSNSTVNQELLTTYLKPLPPPDLCYLQLVKDIKDQLACNHAEGTQQMKWEACSSPLPAKTQEYCMPSLPRRPGCPWANPTRTHFFYTCEVRIMQWSGSTVDPLAHVCWFVTSVARLKIRPKLDYFSTKY